MTFHFAFVALLNSNAFIVKMQLSCQHRHQLLSTVIQLCCDNFFLHKIQVLKAPEYLCPSRLIRSYIRVGF